MVVQIFWIFHKTKYVEEEKKGQACAPVSYPPPPQTLKLFYLTQFLFYKILKNKWYHAKVLPEGLIWMVTP